MSEPVLETRDLSMRFGGVLAVNNVSFRLRERELRCLIGPNGAGKSTFFKCLTGQIPLDHSNGRVLIRGHDVTGWRSNQIVGLGVGIKTQVPSLMNGLTTWENIWLSARRTHGYHGADAEAERVVDLLRLGGVVRQRLGELAHGQRQIIELGVVLAQHPWLVLLDEPAAGITGGETERLVELVQEVNRTASVIVIDHDMHFVRMLGGQITVLHQGAILVEGNADAVLSDARVREVYIGTRAK